MKDKEIIEYFCTLNLSELNYYKGVIEGLILKNHSQHGLTDLNQTAIDVVGQGAENPLVKVSNPSADILYSDSNHKNIAEDWDNDKPRHRNTN